jgi:glycosyltransferase involved in cell wall biosynthesis
MERSIAFISDHASPLAILGGVDSGGQNVYVGELAKELSGKGYRIDIFTRMDDEDLPEIIDWVPNVRVIHIKAGPVCPVPKEELLPYMVEFTDHMLDFIEREQASYALIHANFFMSAHVACQIKKVKGIPFVVTFHALGYIRRIYQREKDKFPIERIAIESKIVEEADRIIAECPQDKEDLIDYYAACPDKIAIVACGFDPSEFYPVDKTFARTLLKLPKDGTLLLQLGRMVPRKGVDNVISALGCLKKKGLSAHLIIVGGERETDDGTASGNSEMNRLKDIARQACVESLIHFVGHKDRDQLRYYYSAADVFITTPWYEPFGITPLEAMACGVPVIGANVGGIKFTVRDNKTGFLVPPRDPDALANKILTLVKDEALATRMKRRAIKRVNKLFTWDRVADSMDNIYREVIAEPLHSTLTVVKKPWAIERVEKFIAHTYKLTISAFSGLPIRLVFNRIFSYPRKDSLANDDRFLPLDVVLNRQLQGHAFILKKVKRVQHKEKANQTKIFEPKATGFEDHLNDHSLVFNVNIIEGSEGSVMDDDGIHSSLTAPLTMGKNGYLLGHYQANIRLNITMPHDSNSKEVYLRIMKVMCELIEVDYMPYQ